MPKEIYNRILQKLVVEVPLFAETILRKALEKLGTTPEEATPFQLKIAIEKYVEPALKEKLNLRKGLHELGMGIIILDKEGKVKEASPAAYKLIPDLARRKYVLGNDITSETVTAKGNTVRIIRIPVLKRSAESGDSVCMLSDMTLDKELDKEMLEKYQQLLDQNRKLVEMRQAQEKSENALMESEEQLRYFLENMDDLVQSVDENGKFLFINRKWASVLGYSVEQARNMHFIDIISKDYHPMCEDIFSRLLKGEIFHDIDTVFITKKGRERQVHGNARPYFKDGKFVSTISIYEDVTEQRKAEEELQKRNRELERFNKLAVGRELKMIELKRRVSELENTRGSPAAAGGKGR